jgi:glycosyltransferase involved in cell wall biosynthesis
MLIENGIDTEQFTRRQSKDQAKSRLDLPRDRLVIGAVGRLSREKGFDVLLQAAAQLLARGIEACVVIAGEGEEAATLRGLAARLGIGDRLHLLGYCADPRAVFEAMDVFALSSHREGLPNVLLEAAAMEVPIVATRIAGVPRLVLDGETGLLVEPGSVPSLAAGLERLLRDESLRQRLASAGRRRVETHYSFARRIEKIGDIYDKLLAAA